MVRQPVLFFVVGARPNFVKAAPVLHEANRSGRFRTFLVHTGQHYDAALSDHFFRDLDLPRPDLHLEVGSGTHAFQTGEVMRRLEPVLTEMRPDWLVVFGDVNSTVAASLTAAKLRVPVAHVEAGLRSFDNDMPEEINRRVTDCLSDLLFVTEESGLVNLTREGVAENKIHLVGNTMVDSLRTRLEQARERSPKVRSKLGIEPGGYGVLTLHRPSNVDDPSSLDAILSAVLRISRELPVVFPAHPRTHKQLSESTSTWQSLESEGDLRLTEPLGYLDFLGLMDGARLMLTDSGGIQEETTALGVPCLTLRENTERPVTLTHGTNRLVGTRGEKIFEEAMKVLRAPDRRGAHPSPPLWDGEAAGRIVAVLTRESGA